MTTTRKVLYNVTRLVGYTFHFKMTTTLLITGIKYDKVGYTFHFKMTTTLLITIACYIIN